MFVTHGTLSVTHGLLKKQIISHPGILSLLKYHYWVITRNTRPLPCDTSNNPVVPFAGRTTGTLIISHGRPGEGLRYGKILPNFVQKLQKSDQITICHSIIQFQN